MHIQSQIKSPSKAQHRGFITFAIDNKTYINLNSIIMIRKLLLVSTLLSLLLFVNCQEDDFLQEQNEPISTSKLAASTAKSSFSFMSNYANEKIHITNSKQEAFKICSELDFFNVWSLYAIVYNNTDKDLIFKKQIAWGNSFFINTAPYTIPPKKYAIIYSGTINALQTGVYSEFIYQYENITTCFGSYLPQWHLGMSCRSSNVLVNFSEFNNVELNYHSRPTMTKRLGNLEISGKITPLSYGPHYAEFTISTLSNLNNSLNTLDYITSDYESARKMVDGLKKAYGTALTAKIIIHNKSDKNLVYKDRSSWYGSSFFSKQPSVIPAHKYAVILAQHKSQSATGVYNELTYKHGKQDISFGTYVPWSWAYTNNVLVDFKEINYGNLSYNSTRPSIHRTHNGLRLTGHIDKGDSPHVLFTVEKQ